MRLFSIPEHRTIPLIALLTAIMGTLFSFHVTMAEPGDAKSLRVAETILLYQRSSGGWPKNYDREDKLSQKQRAAILSDRNNNDTMIDNGATHREIRLLAVAYGKTQDKRFRDAALRGIDYLLKGQYKNGGWPQRFPEPQGYAKHITFNDDAMIGVMSLLRDISDDRQTYSFVSRKTLLECADAVARGTTCILKCQIKVNGQLTAWCAQHDENTFLPRKARSYELASLSGHESVGIVRFLMHIDQPSPEIIESIEGAVRWFEQSKLTGIKEVRVKAPDQLGGYDKIVVQDAKAPPLWARFYDITTNNPIFCSRDGIPRKTMAEISHERRNNYSWLGQFARDLFAKDLPAWKKRLERNKK
ncbi:MAG: pectate lyase [Planctomycetaceae bacterium]|nr:pectate lyase [Planctomycetaceae bacterium]